MKNCLDDRPGDLFFTGGFGFFSSFLGFCGEIYDLATVIISAFHADRVALVLCAAMATLGKTRFIECVMRAAVVAVRASCSHSIYHSTDILAYLFKICK